MDIYSLETFITVAECRNFTKAAIRQFCTQAAISLRIKKLEETVGCRLFERQGRTVSLTKEGEVLLPYAQQIVNSWEGAQSHLLQSRLMEQSEISITSSSTPGTYIIPSVMYLFRQQYPYITILNHVQYTTNAIADVLAGKFAVGIVSQPLLSNTNTLLCEPFMEDPLILVVSPVHPWAKETAVSLNMLMEETLLISNPNTSLVGYLEEAGQFKLDSSRLYVAGNIEAIKRGICNNQGVSVMSKYAVHQELEYGMLKQVAFEGDINLLRKLYLIRRNDMELKLSLRLFLDFIRESVAEDGGVPKL